MSILTLENEHLDIKINSFGAELQSIYDIEQKLECLWQGDEKFWARRAPILFPIVGRLKNDSLMHQGQCYPMTQHGFARDSEFDVIKQDNISIQLSLTHNAHTLSQYPFNFELTVEYLLYKNQLKTTYTITNPDQNSLPVSIGAHPAFNWPLLSNIKQTDHKIIFNHEESCHLRRLNDGLLIAESYSYLANENQINLENDLFRDDAMIFDRLKSNKLHYIAGNDYSITIEFSDFPHLGIWTKPGAPFICLEPWQGYASPMNFDGEFHDKPGILLVPSESEINKSFSIIIN